MRPTALWGWRRGWLAYWVVSAEYAQRAHLEPIASAEFDRDRVTVLV